MSRIQKTKKGVAAIYVVVFTTMLIGIITLSFLRIMLSESGRTLNDTMSDSAYNAALAGVEDAKYVVSKYEKKVSGSDTSIPDDFKNIVETKTDDCDIISEAMEKLHVTGLKDGTDYYIGTDGSRSDQDQAYTCVTIKLEGDFRGTLTSNDPTLIVPLKPSGKGNNTAKNVAKIELTWYSSGDDDDVSNAISGHLLENLQSDGLNGAVNNTAVVSSAATGVLGKKGVKSDDEQTIFNGLRMMLVQSSLGDTNPDYYSSDVAGNRTNRGTLMLLPSLDGVTEIGEDAHGKNQLVLSADKNLNAPQAVKCENGICKVTISLPNPKDPMGGDRDPDNFFLVLNTVYSNPTTKVIIKMKNSSDEEIPFFNVQPIVDSTGRSGDLFRRVEARIGTKNGATLLPTAELSSNSDIKKDFYVTEKCIQGTDKCK